MDGHAALIVELLRGTEVQGIERGGTADAFPSDILQAVINPRVGHGKDERAVALHKNILLLRGNGLSPAAAGWDEIRPAVCGLLGWRWLVRGGLFRRRRGSLVSIHRRWQIEAAINERDDKAVAETETVAAVATKVGMRREKVRVIKTEAGYWVSIKG